MVHGTVKGLLGLISTLVFIALVALAGSAYRLSQGPVSLAFLTPSIAEALARASGGNVTVALDETSLVWDADDKTLEIRVRNVHVANAAGHLVASVPNASVSFAGPPLLIGDVVVRGVRVIRPQLRLLRTAQGVLALGLGDDVDADAAALLDSAIGGALTGAGPAAQPAGGSASRGLERFEIVGGDLHFDDNALDMHWHAPTFDLLLAHDPSGFSGTLKTPIDIGGQTATLGADGLYSAATGLVSGKVKWTGVKPSYFAKMLPALQPLARLQLVTGGTADFAYATDKGLTDLTLDISGGQGSVDFAPMVDRAVHVASIAIKGKWGDGLDTVTLDELRLDLGGPRILAVGKAKGLNGVPHFDGTARIDEMPVDTVKTLWPASVAPNPRAWIVANLSGGTIHHAEMKVAASVPGNGGDMTLESMSGELKGDGIAVHYFGSLPAAHNVSATGVFDQDALTLTIVGGAAAGVEVKGGTIKLGGFNDREQIATIHLDAATTVRDGLRLIDAKPLGYAQALGFDPERAKGDATIAIDLSFPLVKTLRLAQLKLRAHAGLTALAVPNAALGLDLANGALNLDVDPKGMDVAGKATLATIPIDLKWHENFAPAAYRSRYEVKASLDDKTRKAIGLDSPAFQPPVVTGPVPVEAIVTMLDSGKGEIAMTADLRNAAMRFPGLNWSKVAGEPGAAQATIRIAAGGIVAVPQFSVTGGNNLEMYGDIAFDAGSHPRRISLSTAKWGRTDFKGSVLFRPDGSLNVDVSGASFDASELAGGDTGEQHLEENLPLNVTAKLGRVWLSPDGSLVNVGAVMARGPRHWRNIRVDAIVGQGRSLHVEIKPATELTRRTLKVTCDDAGAVFNAFGVLKNIRGGTLAVDGVYYDAQPTEPLIGTVKMTNYAVVKAPLLAKVLTVASLTGAGDVLSGTGIRFSKAEAQFTLANDVVTLKDARTSGTELGITAKGQIDLANDQLALEGTIVPAYAINGAVEDIPVIGSLLSGEKGGGLFAFSYSVKGPSADPAVSVNPLSALTPGFLRGLFGMFDGPGASTVPAPPAKSGEAQSPDKSDH